MASTYVGYNHQFYYDHQDVLPSPEMFQSDQPRSEYRHHQHASFAQYEPNNFGHYNHAPQGVYPDDSKYMSSHAPRRVSDHAIEDDNASYSPSSSPISRHDSVMSRHDSAMASSPPPSRHSSKDLDDRAYCTHHDCKDSNGRPIKSFSRKADVARHVRSAHERRYIDCPMRRCNRKGDQGFTRHDHLVEHRRQFHMEVIPKKGGRRESGSSSGSVSAKSRHSA